MRSDAIASTTDIGRQRPRDTPVREIADRTQRAVAELQDAIDAARLAGLIVEPSFTRIENRLTQCGARVDSFVGRVHILRRWPETT